jgi:hypothetical protein
MYILKRNFNNGNIGYLTFDGWKVFTEGGPLDLTDVARFTKREAELNRSNLRCEWQHYGCYPKLKRGK